MIVIQEEEMVLVRKEPEHMQEELIDAILYLERLKREITVTRKLHEK